MTEPTCITEAYRRSAYTPHTTQEYERMSVSTTIAAQFEAVAREQGRKLAPLSDDLKLLQSGLDSLSFALIVARLEDALGFDPFDTDEPIKFPVTFGDFVKLYENQVSA